MFKSIATATFAIALLSTPALARHRGSFDPAETGTAHVIATQVARQHGVSPAIVHAVMKVESGGRCHVTSSANAQGAMQVKPATARGVGVHGNLHDCRTGITAGVLYLKTAIAVNHGNLCAAFSSYNTGTGIRGRCSGYGRKVLSYLGRVRVAAADSESTED